ncbi:hypothetical protein A2971_00920 [Candidatus Gottesmanbacteria bacterium RIFCSPLOWO2_01_FULL_46_21]|uniref:Uncharacterized protein n=3 Tax=Candidatus Gottesmaniibacteriota TaxID=1752720 RepID=A0A1F6AZ70_9BACT|nr:MAG: hypothetical protein A2971_00920 [Candidatus Gottesmanbacteria bacterium RIFCSPLOWO2_01_FULL_46_21]
MENFKSKHLGSFYPERLTLSRERGKVQTEREVVMPTQVKEVDRSIIGLIPGTDQQVSGDIWKLFTVIPNGGQGNWQARVDCKQPYETCPAKGGSTGIICDAVNTDGDAWEKSRILVPVSGTVCCGKAPSVQASLEMATQSS